MVPLVSFLNIIDQCPKTILAIYNVGGLRALLKKVYRPNSAKVRGAFQPYSILFSDFHQQRGE